VVPRTTPFAHVPNGDVLVAQQKNNQKKETMQMKKKNEEI
jgi:hypothetical protein